MEETMLDRARANLLFASHGMSLTKSDDVHLNFVAYHIQQAVELALNHLITIEGVRYAREHDISKILRYAEDNCIPVKRKIGPTIYNDLVVFSDVLTTMETKTRYTMDYRPMRASVEKMLTLAAQLIAACSK